MQENEKFSLFLCYFISLIRNLNIATLDCKLKYSYFQDASKPSSKPKENGAPKDSKAPSSKKPDDVSSDIFRKKNTDFFAWYQTYYFPFSPIIS